MSAVKTSKPPETAFKDKGTTTIVSLQRPIYLLMGICLVLLGWLYTPTFRGWYVAWMKEESYYSHGILVPFISLFIIWLNRKQLSVTPIKPCALGYLMVAPALLITVAGVWMSGSVMQGVMFPVALGGLILVLLGRAMARYLVFPVGYLYFMVVMPGDILTKLSFRIQIWSTMSATSFLKVIGYDAWREGVTIALPNIDVLVGAPCSGFRLLISLFAFSVLFVYLKEGPKWGKALLIALTLPLSVLLNSIRIMMIAMVGEHFGSDAMHAFHDWSGYIMLVLAFVVLSVLARFVKCQKFSSILSS